MTPIIPTVRSDPFDDPAHLFELKYDGFRGLADTLNYRMLSKTRNRMKRFEGLLEALPEGYGLRWRDSRPRRNGQTAVQ
jgi:ATP-dependent DNA ligase